MKKIIALITDFGYKDPYVGVVKGVIKSINPDVEIVDLTHGITRHNILEAAVVLAVSAKYFPKGTIFVVVVDPGVGSSRRAILIETSNYILVGPDNGCLTLLAELDGVKRVFDISNSKYRLQEVSATFHGRDVFAPVAAHVSRGIPLEEIGVEIRYEDLVKLAFTRPRIDLKKRIIEAQVVYIDVYGNVMTNVQASEIRELINKMEKLRLTIHENTYECPFVPSFSWVPEGELACYINSWGFLEIAVNKGSAADTLGLKLGDKLSILFNVKQVLNDNPQCNSNHY